MEIRFDKLPQLVRSRGWVKFLVSLISVTILFAIPWQMFVILISLLVDYFSPPATVEKSLLGAVTSPSSDKPEVFYGMIMISLTISLVLAVGVLTRKIPDKEAPSNGTKIDPLTGLPIVDLRSDRSKQMEKEGLSPLSGKDEQFARELLVLIQQVAIPGDEADKEIKRIGQYLFDNGGEERMRKVYYRVQGRGGRGRTLEMYWDGVGTWLS